MNRPIGAQKQTPPCGTKAVLTDLSPQRRRLRDSGHVTTDCSLARSVHQAPRRHVRSAACELRWRRRLAESVGHTVCPGRCPARRDAQAWRDCMAVRDQIVERGCWTASTALSARSLVSTVSTPRIFRRGSSRNRATGPSCSETKQSVELDDKASVLQLRVAVWHQGVGLPIFGIDHK